jgi:hypothetical protein
LQIVQNADSSSSLFDDLDAALHSGSSEERVVMPRQVTDLLPSRLDLPLNFMQQRSLRANEAVRSRLLSRSSQIAY